MLLLCSNILETFDGEFFFFFFFMALFSLLFSSKILRTRVFEVFVNISSFFFVLDIFILEDGYSLFVHFLNRLIVKSRVVRKIQFAS